MRISGLAILVLKGSPDIREKIAAKECVSPATVRRWVRDVSKDLTRVSVLDIIREGSGLSDEQLLESTNNELVAK